MAKGFNYTIFERYEKTNGIPYTNIKIKGRFLPFIFFVLTLTISVLSFLLIRLFLGDMLALVFVILFIVFSIIALIYIADIDKTTRLPNYLMLYYKNIKKYNSIFVDGMAYFIESKEKNVDRIIFIKNGKHFI